MSERRENSSSGVLMSEAPSRRFRRGALTSEDVDPKISDGSLSCEAGGRKLSGRAPHS